MYKRQFVDIISDKPVKDSEGFTEKGDVILASVRAYKEDRHGSEKWANRAAFSQASALFRFRRIPNLEAVSYTHLDVYKRQIFSRQAVTNSILQKLKPKEKPKGTPIESLEKRLFLLKP